MNWDRISDYCLRSGFYSVAKYQVRDRTYYEAWHRKEHLAACLDSADEAKAVCEKHAMEQEVAA